jgi:ATP-dependent helicase/nuclease subunit A
VNRLLLRHDGRRRLVARLGPEAEDGIDAFSPKPAYEAEAVPSLTGFLEWRGQDEVEVKRQMDGAGDRIRVMTVHGAKGLEAPIVILPDCGAPQGAAPAPRSCPCRGGATSCGSCAQGRQPRAMRERKEALSPPRSRSAGASFTSP